MDERKDETGAWQEGTPRRDMDEGTHVGFQADSGDDQGQPQLELHQRHDRHDTAHVDLLQEEYSPEEAARLIGTSLQVIMEAIWHGDLKAERQGRNVICIQNHDLADWLRRRNGV